jgi:hypothetical protein
MALISIIYGTYLSQKSKEVKMYAKEQILSIVGRLPDSMNFGEILGILSTLYVQKYSLIDQGTIETRTVRKKEALPQEA